MTKISLFRSRTDIDAALRLEGFIRYSREELTWLSDRADFDWFASEWPFARWTKVFVGKRKRVGGDEILDAGFIEFAKAYFRYKNTERPTLTKWEVPALKCMEAALLSVTGSSSLQGLSFAVLDEAAVVAREHFRSQARYHVGRCSWGSESVSAAMKSLTPGLSSLPRRIFGTRTPNGQP